jgi:phage I-like protein
MRYKGTPQVIKLDEISPAVVPNAVQLLRAGSFKSEQYGALEITEKDLAAMVKNFQNKVRGIDLAVDYMHASEDVAAGWFKNVYLNDIGNELWAEVDWTKPGLDVLANKEFRYISAEFDFEYKSNETGTKFGPTLLGAGLTNRPFIKDMKPVIPLSEASEKKEGTTMDEKDKKIAELQAQIESLKTELEQAKKDKSQPSGTPGLSATDAENFDAMKVQLEQLQKKVSEYENQVKKHEEEKKLAEKTGTFNKLLSEGKVVEAQREPFMTGDTIKFAENARPLNLSGLGTSETTESYEHGQDADTAILGLANKWLNEKKVQTLSEGVHKVLRENAELKKRWEAKR